LVKERYAEFAGAEKAAEFGQRIDDSRLVRWEEKIRDDMRADFYGALEEGG
jgi:hypothetical protein